MTDTPTEPGTVDQTAIRGIVVVELTRPDADGNPVVVDRQEIANRVTQTGSEMYAKRGAGISSPPASPTGMRLGTSTTAAAFTSTGSFIVAYISGSNEGNAATYPQSAAQGNGWRATYRSVWAAGDSTNATINECALTNESGPTDVQGTAANTVSRVVFSTTVDKQAGDTLTVTWFHDLAGA